MKDLDLGTLKKPVFACELAVAANEAHKAGAPTAILRTPEGGWIAVLAQPLTDKTPITVSIEGPVVIAPVEGYAIAQSGGASETAPAAGGSAAGVSPAPLAPGCRSPRPHARFGIFKYHGAQ